MKSNDDQFCSFYFNISNIKHPCEIHCMHLPFVCGAVETNATPMTTMLCGAEQRLFARGPVDRRISIAEMPAVLLFDRTDTVLTCHNPPPPLSYSSTMFLDSSPTDEDSSISASLFQ